MSAATATSTVSTFLPSAETLFHLRQAFKLALSLVLFYWLALTTNWDVPIYGALAITLVSLDTTGASIEKGLLRVLGTTFGVLVGFLFLSLFSNDRWALLAAFFVYLAIVGYFMQASRYSYAWFVAAFLPLVVWADNYPNFGSAFYFGVFRYLETTVGVIIYTMVDLLLWPQRAGTLLPEQGGRFWQSVQELFQNRQSQGDADSTAKVKANLTQLAATLDSAYIDSLDIRAKAPQWEVWRLHAGRLVDIFAEWQPTDANAPQIEIIHTRLERLTTLWREASHIDFIATREDASLLTPLTFDADTRAVDVELLKKLDNDTRQLLRVQRELLGWDSAGASDVSPQREYFARLLGWDPKRMVQALFPPLAFVAGYVFWIIMDPPGGAKVPFFTGIYSLMVLRMPMNLAGAVIAMVLITLLVVAPIYWLVMPALSTGVELLTLVFVYALVFGLLGGRSPALKTFGLLMFVAMTGISNQQTYSFNSMIDGSLMMILAGIIVSGVYEFFKPPSV